MQNARQNPRSGLPPNKLNRSVGLEASVERFRRSPSSDPRLVDGLPGKLVDADTGVVAPRLVSFEVRPFVSFGSEFEEPVVRPNMRLRLVRLSRATADSV